MKAAQSAKTNGLEALRPMLDDLARSGLTSKDAVLSGMTPVAPPWANGHPGYLIPYGNPDGRLRQDLGRWRFTPPLLLDGGKQQKYTQPAGVVGAYFSLLFPWPAHLRRLRRLGESRKDNDFLAITEGEKKAARACKDGLPPQRRDTPPGTRSPAVAPKLSHVRHP
jgi:hypothetical protein